MSDPITKEGPILSVFLRGVNGIDYVDLKNISISPA